MPIKHSIGKTYLALLLISTILTSVVTGFVYGVYQNFQSKVTDGESQEYNLFISATGTVGIKTKHQEFYGDSETEIEEMSKCYSTISKGDVVKMFNELPESVLNDIEFVDVAATADDNVYGLMVYSFTFTPTKNGLIPYGVDVEQFTDELLTAPLFIISQIVFPKFIYPVMLDYFPDMVGSFNFKVYAFMFAAWLIITIASVVILLKKKTHKRLNIMEDE